MAGEIIASADLLRDRAEKLRTLFDSDHSLRLFSNDFKPGVKDLLPIFAEASFPGYARKTLAGEWKPVLKLKDGCWQFSSKDQTFTATGASNEVIYGWYIVGGGKLKLSCRLPFGKLMTVGQTLTVRIDCLTWAAAIL